MELTKRNFLFFLIVLIVLLPFLILIYWPQPSLYLIACDVGQGDAILITQGFTQVLIDGGPNNQVLSCLGENMPFWDRTIELVVNTHPDKDHLAGLIDVIERYRVEQLVSNDLSLETKVFEKFSQQVKKKRIPVYSPQQKDKIRIKDLEFEVLWPRKKVLGQSTTKKKTNDFSIVLHLKYGAFDALLAGDINEDIEAQIVRENEFKDIEVLKVAHHGSKYATSEEFLKAVEPQIAIISVGKNSWGHPTSEVLERLTKRNIQILRTDKEEVKIKI